MIRATYINHMGDDLTVVNAARVSFGKKVEALGYSGADGGTMQGSYLRSQAVSQA